jgi:hypothetical protein
MGEARGSLLVAALVVSFALAGCGKPAEISTKTEACAANLVEGLRAFQTEMGMPFDVNDGDGQVVFDQGAIEKRYARDGNRYEVSFRPQRDGEDCDLVLHKRTTRQPGSRETRHGNFGAYTLEHCECE